MGQGGHLWGVGPGASKDGLGGHGLGGHGGGRGRPGRLSGAETKLPRRKGSQTLREQRGGGWGPAGTLGPWV